MQAGDLRCKVTFYEPASTTNALGEDVLKGLTVVKADVPAQIVPTAGANLDTMGDLDTTQITHKIRIRAGAVTLKPELVIMYNGQRYDVRYWQPVYNNQRFMEILTVMEVSI